MTTTTNPNSFAKIMESNTKRLIQQKHLRPDASLPHRKMPPSASFPSLQLRSRCENDATTSSSSTSVRLCGGMAYKNDKQVTNRHTKWRSPIGTIADHRMTNNNRIRKQWHKFAVIPLSLFLCIVQVTVVNGHPDPTPIRVSNSYTKTVSNTIPTSTTSRSTTQITSFLPSDAISSLSSSVINYKNFNTFASNRSSSGGSSINSGIYSFKHRDVSSDGKSNNNANIQSSSRRLASAKASRKDFSSSPATSIDRPFYTKITSNDAVATPSHYKRTKAASKKKKSKNSSKSPSYSKYSKTKGSKEHGSSMSVEEIDNDEYAFMPQTTEKSYHPPKLSLEPFFNFLTSLATASREVIMSKEQYHHNNNHEKAEEQENDDDSLTITGDSSKYSPSYETINQSIREGAKKTKKSKKGSSKSKKKGKGHKKGSKGKRHRIKSMESLSLEDEEDEINLDGTPNNGPVPIPLPNPIIDSPEDAKEDDSPSDGMDSSLGLHILDVLRTPMIPDYEPLPSLPAVRAEPLVADYHENSGSSSISSSINSNIHQHTSSNTSSSSSLAASSNPPSGRANQNKGQGYLKFDKYEGPGTKNVSMMQKQRSERDQMDSFHDPHSDVDLQAQESISHAQVLPSPFGMKNEAGGGLPPPSQYQFQQQQHFQPNQPYPPQQQPKSNNELSLASASQQVSLTQNNAPDFAPAGKSSVDSSESNAFRRPHPNGKNDFVSKYPTTFVYQSNSPAGPSPPASRPGPYMNPSPPGFSPNTGVVYGSPPHPPPSSRPPFRMNKLRPNLHSYYDSSYHNYAGLGESQAASEMIGIRHPYGPPHFKPPPHAMHNPLPLPSPPRFVNGYGNRPNFMMMPHRGSHYVGHTLNTPHTAPSLSSNEPMTKPYDDPNTDYQQDFTGNSNNNNNEDSSVDNQDISGSDVTGSSSDGIDQYTLSEVDENSVAAENSETKKVGIMESFDVFYKEYKILTWVAVFFVTSMALLTLLVYLYINNPPTEVVQARQLFPWNDLLKNPQITKFLSSLTSSSSSASKRKRKKDDDGPSDYDHEGYLKPYGHGFGDKSGRQKRKQTRSKQDKVKFVRRVNKIKRLNESGSNNSNGEDDSTIVAPSSSADKITASRNNSSNRNRSLPSTNGRS